MIVDIEQDSKKEKKFVKDVVRKGQEMKENTSKAFHESVRPSCLTVETGHLLARSLLES